MTDKDNPSDYAAKLRQRAEKIAMERERQSLEDIAAISPEAICQMLHEMRVRQIELEIENEEALNVSVVKYKTLFDVLPVGVTVSDNVGNIVECNNTAERILNLSKKEQIKRKVDGEEWRIIRADRSPMPVDEFASTRALKENRLVENVEMGIIKSGDKVTWITVSSAPIPLENYGVAIAFSDITQIKQDEDIRFDLERRLLQAQKAESLGRMAGAIAHHYNNLLGAVIGNLELAMLDLPVNSPVTEKLAAAMSASNHASEIGKLMLAYLGHAVGRREPIDLVEICRQYLSSLSADIPEHVVMKYEFPSTGPVIIANADQIRQILSSLIANACEAMDERHGSIILGVRTVSSEEMPQSIILATHCFPTEFRPGITGYASLEVRDMGSGIAESEIEKLFDPFYSTRFTGRGLGLPVVLGAVKSHNGCVTVESELGRGSIFRVFLPISGETISFPKPQESGITTKLRVGVVLLVEDEPMVRKMAVAMLKSLGMTVLEASDGVEAVELFQLHRNEIICVLCDLTMPRMDGWATLETMRRLSPAIPFVLVSGYDQNLVMEGDHAELPQDFLSKPYGMMALKNALAKATKES